MNEEIKKLFATLHKRLNILIGIMLVALLILTLTLFFYKRADKPSKDETNALQLLNEALNQQRESKELNDKTTLDNAKYFHKKDSLDAINQTNILNEIKKVRDDKKINDIRSYTKPDILREFANLERQFLSNR